MHYIDKTITGTYSNPFGYFGGFGGPFSRKIYLNQLHDEVSSDEVKPTMVKKPEKHHKYNEEYHHHQQQHQQQQQSKSAYENQYPAHQYPNGIGPWTTIVGAAIAPAIIPFQQHSQADTSRPSKPTTSESNKQQSDWQSNDASYYNSNKIHVRKDKPAHPVYFEFLNTYTPGQNYPNLPSFKGANQYENQFAQSNGQFIQMNRPNSYGRIKSDGSDYTQNTVHGYNNPSFDFNGIQYPKPSNY